MEALIDERRTQLDVLFEGVCELVQIPASLFDEATKHYLAVGDWLNACNSMLRAGEPDIYPYGSMATNTEVRPVSRSEFDLDQICLVQAAEAVPDDPQLLFDAVVARLGEHKDLKERMDIDPPAIRLKYANEFTLEVVPASTAHAPAHPSAVNIVDYSANEWIPTDPKAYIDWFEGKSIVRPSQPAHSRIAASVEPPPEHATTKQRSTLARVVQLFKRRRDLFYAGLKRRPASVVLTTLAAKHYGGQLMCYEGLQSILLSIKREIASGRGLILVLSPVFPFDDLTRNWGVRDHQLFAAFVERVLADLGKLERARNLVEIASILSEMFGEDVTNNVVRSYGENLKLRKDQGALSFAPNAPVVIPTKETTGSKPIKEHTFFGE